MTGELARSSESLTLMTPDPARLRLARLERLRIDRGPGQAGGRARTAAPTPRSGEEPGARGVEDGAWGTERGAWGTEPARVRGLARDLGGAVVAGPSGPVVVVEHRLPMSRGLADLACLPDPVDPARPIICLDTETTGLGTAAGTVPFMVGLGTWQEDTFVVRQLVLADHADERALLAALAGWIPADGCLVTYNGRSFDWPLLVARYRLHGEAPPPHLAHLDLLPLARQVWKHRLADARLGSVERGVAGVERAHDLPGAFIPTRYLDYLRSRNGALLREVLEHNRQDVVSLALLLRHLAESLLPAARGAAGPRASGVHPDDLGGLGRLLARRKRHVDALACFDEALERVTHPWEASRHEVIMADRARTLTRLGRRAEAEGAWHALALEGGRMAALAWLQVAKHREHDAGDLPAALEATRRARALADRARLLGRRDRLAERDLARRVPRLQRRLQGQRQRPAGVAAAGA